MKKNLLFYVLVLITITLKAQLASVPVNGKAKSNAAQRNTHLSGMRTQSAGNHTAAVIWSSDFSITSDWTMTEEIAGGGNWFIDATGPVGTFTIGPIVSTSYPNGWATFDSDNLCTGDQISDMRNTNPINCSGHPSVLLKFQQFYRRYYDSTYVLVSTDAVTWTKFPVNASYANNVVSPNPDNVSIDVSSVAGNQPAVYIGFQFYSPSSVFGSNAGCGYAWEIDDVSLEDAVTDDIAMVPGYPSQYVEIPVRQVQAIPLTGRVRNGGTNTEANVQFDAYVFAIHGGVPTLVLGPVASNAASSLLAGDTTAMLSAGNYTPPDTGVYAFLYISSMTAADQNTSNDTLLNYLIVDENMYARDNTDLIGLYDNNLGFNSSDGKLGQLYDVYNADTVSSVTFFLGLTHMGDSVSASVYTISGGMPGTLLGTTANHIITAADSVNWVTLPFSPAVPVGAGQFAIVLNQISSVNNVALAFDHNVFTPQTTFYKAGTAAWAYAEAAGFPGAFVLRPNLGAASCNLNVTTGVVNASCISCSDGSATAIVSGGVSPYSYTWYTAPLQVTQTATALAPGTYTVCISDAMGCTSCVNNVTVGTGCSTFFYVYADASPHTYNLVNMATGTPPLTYDWNWGDGSPHDTAAYPSHTYASSANYTICLDIIDATSCTDSYCHSFYLLSQFNSTPITVHVIPNTTTQVGGINKDKAFSVSPNPFTDVLIVHSPENTPSVITLYDYTGKKILSTKSTGVETVLNTGGIAAGIYLLKAESGAGVMNYKVVKQQ